MGAVEPVKQRGAFKFKLINPDGIERDITDLVTSISVEYSLDAGHQIDVEVHDPNHALLKNGYFRMADPKNGFMGTEYAFDGQKWILSSLDYQQGDGGTSGTARLGLREKTFQRIKGNLKPQMFRSVNGYGYAKKVAEYYGLKFFGENVKGKQNAQKIKTKYNKTSAWQVLQAAADNNQYLCFIADDTLFFVSPRTLVGAYGIDSVSYRPYGESKKRKFKYVPLEFPTPDKEKRFFLTEHPTFKKDIDDPKEAEGSCRIFGPASRNLRAGMTVYAKGFGDIFSIDYIITKVTYDYLSAEPAQVSFSNVIKLAPPDKKNLDNLTENPDIVVLDGTEGNTTP